MNGPASRGIDGVNGCLPGLWAKLESDAIEKCAKSARDGKSPLPHWRKLHEEPHRHYWFAAERRTGSASLRARQFPEFHFAPSSATATPVTTKSDTATGKDPLQPETHEGFWGRMNPFARKKYVARQTQPIRDRINELDELTAANTSRSKTSMPAHSRASSSPPPRPPRPISTRWKPATRRRPRSRPPTMPAPPEHRRAGGHQYRSISALDPDRNSLQARTDRAEQECQGRAR